MLSRILAASLIASNAAAQMQFLPLKDIRKGMRGTGRTVFIGEKIESFDVEILGVLENLGPKQSLILGRLSGGPLAHTGVMQGMSGSPVYIQGKLIGAVAMAFPYSKDPIAGIRPIEEMLAVPPTSATTAGIRRQARIGEADMIDIATPVSFNGFTRAALDAFAPQLKELGWEPRQGLSAGGDATTPAKGRLEPGAMISVQLVTGDLNAGADGTVTHIDGGKVYAFGHRFLASGAAEMPFARAEVLTLLPNVNTSFKISTARGWVGSITEDRNAAVSGLIGKRAAMIPVTVSVRGSGRKSEYKMEVMSERFLTPFLTQMAVYSAIDGTERSVGAGSLRMRGEIALQDGLPPVKLENIYYSDFASPVLATLGAVQPVAYLLQGTADNVRAKSMRFEFETWEGRRPMSIDRAALSRAVIRPGEKLTVSVTLSGAGGQEKTQSFDYTPPVGIPSGPIYITISDGSTANAAEMRASVYGQNRTARQMIAALNQWKSNSSAWVRIWRAETGYQVAGEDLPSPPASLALLLARPLAGQATPQWAKGAKLAEFEMKAGDFAVTGSKTLQAEVRE